MPRSEESRRKKNAAKAAFILTLIIVLLIYSNSIYLIIKDFRNPKFVLDMKKTEDFYSSQVEYYHCFTSLMEFREQNSFVPDYKVGINISIEKKLFKEVIFSISIVDEGILKLCSNTWYFHIVIANNEQIKAIFPGGPSGYKQPSSSCHAYAEKWNLNTYLNRYYENALIIRQNGKNYYFPQTTLKNGFGKYVYEEKGVLRWSEKDYQIFYRFIPDEIGEWDIFILVFDEEYKVRKEKEVLHWYIDEFESEFKDNAVGIEKFIIDIKEKKSEKASRTESILKILGIVSIITSLIFGSIYKVLRKKQEFFIQFYNTIRSDKEVFLLLILILVLIGFLTYFIWEAFLLLTLVLTLSILNYYI